MGSTRSKFAKKVWKSKNVFPLEPQPELVLKKTSVVDNNKAEKQKCVKNNG